MPIFFGLDLSFLPLKPSLPSLNNDARISPQPSSITSISHYHSVKSSRRMTAENTRVESMGAGATASEVTDFSCQNDLQWGLALWQETKELWHETKRDRGESERVRLKRERKLSYARVGWLICSNKTERPIGAQTSLVKGIKENFVCVIIWKQCRLCVLGWELLNAAEEHAGRINSNEMRWKEIINIQSWGGKQQCAMDAKNAAVCCHSNLLHTLFTWCWEWYRK